MPWNPKVLAHISDVLRQRVPPSVVLDGELYCHGWPLQRINGAVSVARTEPIPDTLEVAYHIFDHVDFKHPFGVRWAIVQDELAGFINDKPSVRLVPTVKVTEPGDADILYSKYVSDGYEGIMYRLGACPYTIPKQEGIGGRLRHLSDKNNRVWHMLKRKDWQDAEFLCIGVIEGEGKRAGMVGAFECVCGGGRFTVGSGLTDSDALHYFLNPPTNRLIKVKYLTLSAAGIPLNPTVLAVL